MLFANCLANWASKVLECILGAEKCRLKLDQLVENLILKCSTWFYLEACSVPKSRDVFRERYLIIISVKE